jgi:hypothetical protein
MSPDRSLGTAGVGDIGDFGDVRSRNIIWKGFRVRKKHGSQKTRQLKTMSPKPPTSPEYQITL